MIGYSKRIEKIIRESAFDNMKKKPGLIFNPKLALSGVRTIVRWLKAQIYTEWTKAPNFAWL